MPGKLFNVSTNNTHTVQNSFSLDVLTKPYLIFGCSKGATHCFANKVMFHDFRLRLWQEIDSLNFAPRTILF